jgi:hypothetical protein
LNGFFVTFETILTETHGEVKNLHTCRSVYQIVQSATSLYSDFSFSAGS